MEIFRNNPNIDKLIYHKRDSIPNDTLGEYFKKTQEDNKCDKMINLCESIETKLVLHPGDPQYQDSKEERRAKCNKNYYDFTLELGGFPDVKGKTGELFFAPHEEKQMQKFFKRYEGKFVILWGLSGSGRNKTYWPVHAEYIWKKLLAQYEDVIIITVGDEPCRVLELKMGIRMVGLAGLWNIRQSMLATKYADLLISPDTGLLHAAGCFNKPKIGLFGHSTIENVTKYFDNDYSIESQVACAPCFRLIYNAFVQCNLQEKSFATVCMADGLPAQRVFTQIERVIKDHYDRKAKPEARPISAAI